MKTNGVRELPNAEAERLLLGVAKGDEKSLEALFRLTAARLKGVILRIVQDRAVADEVLQDCFIRYWQRAGQFDPQRGSALAWMVTIARNRALSYIRKRNVDQDRIADMHDLPGIFVSGVDRGMTPEERRALRDCLDSLGELQRDCIVLAYCCGYTRDMLAAKTRRPVNTIKTLIRRGLMNLRMCMGGGIG